MPSHGAGYSQAHHQVPVHDANDSFVLPSAGGAAGFVATAAAPPAAAAAAAGNRCACFVVVLAMAASFLAGTEFGVRATGSPTGLVYSSSWFASSSAAAEGSGRPPLPAQALDLASPQPCPSPAASTAPLVCPVATPCPSVAACPFVPACELPSPVPTVLACPTPSCPTAAAAVPAEAASPSVAASPCPSSAPVDSQIAEDAVCPADDLREPGSLRWGSQHWCPEMDTGGTWAPLNDTFVPLVPYGLDTRNDSAHGPRIYYGPEGLIYENNGQGGQTIVRQQDPELLKWMWQPAGCTLRNLTRPQVQAMLKDQWIHLDGDSLVRDHFYDILETLEMGGFGREKKHENLPAHILGLNVDVTFGWSPPGNPPCPEHPVWNGMRPLGRPHDLGPHVWIYSSGLWDIPLETTDAEFLQRLNCTLYAKRPGTLGVYRLNSMYYEPERPDLQKHNRRLQVLNRYIVDGIRRYNCGRDGYLDRWHIADFAPAMYQRMELVKTDTVHYTGVGSRTFTLMLLNVVAEATERLGTWSTPELAAPRVR